MCRNTYVEKMSSELDKYLSCFFVYGGVMNLIKDDIKKLYLRFLISSFGSALITSIYGVVDAMVVGQYYGPIGSSSLGVIAPIWNIIYSLGLLVGIGGSILFSVNKNKNEKIDGNTFFTSSIILGIIISIILWILLFVIEEPMLYFFGADEELIVLCKEYLLPVKISAPVFVFTQILSSFLRNDNNPKLATIAVIIGGIFNIFFDWFLVFYCNMGIMGAGIATCACAFVSILVMCIHFFTKRNTLKLTFKNNIFVHFKNIIINGFSTFIVDLAMGILNVFFNRQILRYFDYNALSIFAIIINIATFVQCCGYGIGQACQPLLSENFGAKNYKRVNKTLIYGIVSSFIVGLIWLILCETIPEEFIKFFMVPTEEVLKIGPKIIRMYSVAFFILPFNVFSTYYFQSILKPYISLIISLARGFVLSGILLYVFGLINKDLIWISIQVTELIVFVFVIINIIKNEKKLKKLSQLSDRE